MSLNIIRFSLAQALLSKESPLSVHPFPSVEHVDVLIIGAGLSGIGLAYYLQRDQPGKTFALLDRKSVV